MGNKYIGTINLLMLPNEIYILFVSLIIHILRPMSHINTHAHAKSMHVDLDSICKQHLPSQVNKS